MRQPFIVFSVGGREIARGQWPLIRRGKHPLQRLDLGNGLFHVHAVFIFNRNGTMVNRRPTDQRRMN